MALDAPDRGADGIQAIRVWRNQFAQLPLVIVALRGAAIAGLRIGMLLERDRLHQPVEALQQRLRLRLLNEDDPVFGAPIDEAAGAMQFGRQHDVAHAPVTRFGDETEAAGFIHDGEALPSILGPPVGKSGTDATEIDGRCARRIAGDGPDRCVELGAARLRPLGRDLQRPAAFGVGARRSIK